MTTFGRAVAMAFLFGCSDGQPAARPIVQGEAGDWRSCAVAADCIWTLGEGGWPAAVNAAALPAYRESVRSQAPFTTYFMPRDCFAETKEFEAYVARSKAAVACVAGSCALEVEPTCTK